MTRWLHSQLLEWDTVHWDGGSVQFCCKAERKTNTWGRLTALLYFTTRSIQLRNHVILTFRLDNLQWQSCWGPHPYKGTERYPHRCSSAGHSLWGTGSPVKRQLSNIYGCPAPFLNSIEVCMWGYVCECRMKKKVQFQHTYTHTKSYGKAITIDLKFKMTITRSKENNNNRHAVYLFGIHVEFLSAHGHLFIPLHVFPVKIKCVGVLSEIHS